MAQPMDIAWMVLKQEGYEDYVDPTLDQSSSYYPPIQPSAPSPEPQEYFSLPQSPQARLMRLYSKAQSVGYANLTDAERDEIRALGGM
jgi:hypothetical protein